MPRLRAMACVWAALLVFAGGIAAAPADEPLRCASSTTSGIRRSQTIRGDQGGMVVAGRFWLWVPAGAWSGPAVVSLSITDPSVLVAELDVRPTPATGFATPVHLFVGLAGVHDLRSATLARWNAKAERWESIEEVARDAEKRELEVKLTRPVRCAVMPDEAVRR